MRAPLRRFRTRVTGGIAAVLFLALAGCHTSEVTPGPTPPPTRTTLPQVRAISIATTESFPVGVAVLASVVLPDCTTIGTITQSRSRNIIDVTIPAVSTATGPVWGCLSVSPIITPTVRVVSVTLQGAFPPADYVVRVNGVAQGFHVD